MSAASYRTDATKQVLNSITSLENRLTKNESAIDGLLKAVSAPASRAGVSPQEFLAASANPKGYALFGQGGQTLQPRGRKNMLGKCTRPDGKAGSFGDWLLNFHDAHKPDASAEHRARCLATMKQYGTGQLGFVRQDHGPDLIVKTALAESSGPTGGYTVPPQFEQQLFELAIENAVVNPRARKFPLTARTLQIPALDQTNTSFNAVAGQSNLLAGVVANWTAEAATRTESEPEFRQVVLTAWELSFYALASNTLLADNAVGLDALLTQLFGYAIGWYTDFAFLQGSGVGQPLGILNSPAAIQVTRQAANHFTFTDVVTMISKLYWMIRDSKSLCWIMHQSVLPELLRLNDASSSSTGYASTNYNPGRVLWIPMNEGLRAAIPESAGVQSAGTLAGWPVLISEKVPALGTLGDVMLVDFDKYALGERMDMEIMVSPHVKFLNNQMAWRIVWRGDGQPLLNKAVTLADGSKTASPYVLLN